MATEATEVTETPSIDWSAPEVQTHIQRAIDQEVTGLKNKNSELLGKLKSFEERYQGIDPDKIQALFDRFDQSDEQRLVKEGKIDEVIKNRTQREIDRYNAQIEAKDKALKALQEERDEVASRAQTFEAQYRRSVIDNTLAKTITGLQDGALAHVQTMVSAWYTVDDNGNVIPTDKAPLTAKGEPVSVDNLKAHLLDVSPFYFKESQGGNMQRGKAGSNGARNLSRAQFDALDHPERKKFVMGGGVIHD